MADPFMSEIRMVAFNFAPRGWAFCDGGTLQIAQNQALFALLGITYGGDGRTTFRLPDLRGRLPMHTKSDRPPYHALGEVGGEPTHLLTSQEIIGPHTHQMLGAPADGKDPIPNGHAFGLASYYRPPTPEPAPTTLRQNMVGTIGGQPHNNLQPYLPIAFCIALQGVFPSRN